MPQGSRWRQSRSSSSVTSAERQLEVHPLLGTQVVGREARARHRAEPLPERLEPVAPDGEARRHVVPAEALQQVAASTSAACRSKREMLRPEPLPMSPSNAIRNVGRP